MLDTKLSIKDYVQREAIPKGKFHFHKKDGRLTGYIPQVGQIIVLDGFERVAKVIRVPNFNRDFMIEFEDGIKERKNLVNDDIEGYLDA